MRGTLRQLRRIERVAPHFPRAWLDPLVESLAVAVETAAGKPLPYIRRQARELLEPLTRRYTRPEAKADAWSFHQLGVLELIRGYSPDGETERRDFMLAVKLELLKLADAAAEAGQ